MTGILASACDYSSTAIAATDDNLSNAELRAEILRLRQENEALKSGKPASVVNTEAAENPAPLVTAESGQARTQTGDAKKLGAVRVNGRRTAALSAEKETPKSVSIVTGEELQKFETNSFQSILKKIGNVRWAGASSQNHPLHTSLTIRGLGYFKSGAGALDPGVGINVDGVSYAYTTLAAGASFYDLHTVDVARGPQGTRGGLGSNLGTISFVTKAPTFTDEAEGSITYGQRETLITKAVIGGGIIDDLLAWRGTFYRETSDGPFENEYNKTHTFGNKDRTLGKVQFLLTPSDDFSARVGVDFTPKGGELDGGTAYGLVARETPAFYDTLDNKGNRIAVDRTTTVEGRLDRRWFKQEGSYNYLGSNNANISGTYPIINRQRGAFAELKYDVAGGTLSSLTAWRDLFFYWNGKGTDDRTVFDVNSLPTAADQTFKQISQEFKFSSAFDTGSYQTGIYYLDKSSNSSSMTRTGADAGPYYANASQYNLLDTDASGRLLLTNSANRLLLRSPTLTEGKTLAVFADLKWDITKDFALDTGLRISQEQRDQKAGRVISDNGFAAELNPSAINNVQLNGFKNDPNGNLTANNAAQLALANSVANKYFGITDYADLSATQKRQVAAAKAIRLARLGALSPETSAESFDDVLVTGNISPSYKINENHTAYISFQHGEKAGVSQIIGATSSGGTSIPVDAEKTNAYELGLKSLFFDGSVSTSASVYLQDIKNYIQPVFFYDEAQTLAQANGLLAYTEGLGNVPKVRSKGFEFDAAYTGKRDSIRFAGAYTDARYREFKNLAKPPELGGTSVPYYDVSGKTLPGAAKVTFNLSADHIQPVFGNKEFHVGANYNYTGSSITEPNLSRYSKMDAYGLTDITIGLGTQNKKFDVSLIAKNVFNVDYGSQFNWNSYSPSEPRWVGINISSKLY
ncbi:MAG: TonB-dependent receptor [Verrucomicrobiaceae bacterium]|nr:TonB-dependent receptor [Verrucomicrobiaceae bacterium]